MKTQPKLQPMKKFKVSFSNKDGDFERQVVITSQDEATAWNWAEKQKESWRASIDVSPKKLLIKVIECPA
jgi:hypothetical protein